MLVSRPLVSVIVPAFNAEAFLADAVRSALAQTWKTLEVVVVDDGSTDRTGAIAHELAAADGRVRVLHGPNKGVSAARNQGIAAASGSLLCFLDADDVYLPDKVERQVAFLDQFPACDLVYSDYYVADLSLAPGLLICRRPPFLISDVLTFRNWFAPLSPLLRASLAERIAGFDETLAGSEDWDYWIRASECGLLSYLPGPVGVYRRHSNQTTRNWELMRKHIERVIVKHRRRGSEAWGNSRATASKMLAEHAWACGQYASMLWYLAEYAWYMRSRRRRRRASAVFPEVN